MTGDLEESPLGTGAMDLLGQNRSIRLGKVNDGDGQRQNTPLLEVSENQESVRKRGFKNRIGTALL